MPLLDFPNELLIIVGANLDHPCDIYALMRTCRRVTSLLISRLHELAILDKDGMNALLWAASKGYEGLIRLLLGKGFNINIRGWSDDYDGKTPLYRAVQSGNVAAAKLLLDKGAKVGMTDNKLATALHEAAAYGSEEMVTLLLDRGASILAGDNYRSTPIHWAASCKNEKTLKLLLQQGSSTNNHQIHSHDITGQTALHSTISVTTHKDSTPPDKVVKLLLEHGAPINSYNRDRQTPLHLAVKTDLDSVVAILLQHGASIHAPDSTYITPLQEAARRGNAKITRQLLEAGASTSPTDPRGQTALDLAFERAARINSSELPGASALIETIELLLESGDSLDIVVCSKTEILTWAGHHGLETIVRLLLRKGIGGYIKLEEGKTILELAASREQPMIARLFQEMVANIETKNP